MKALPPPENLHFDAAEGWLLLGDHRSAWMELCQLGPTTRALPEVLELEWHIHAKAGHWETAYAVADVLVNVTPKRVFGYIHRAYALRRMPGGGLKKAWEALRPTREQFPKNYLIPYNLACYSAQLGRVEEARDWLLQAIKVCGNRDRIRTMALNDKDLESLWPGLRAEDELI